MNQDFLVRTLFTLEEKKSKNITMKIAYIANVRLPTEKAHGIQIMNMCAAFAEYKNTDLALIVPWRFNPLKGDPFEFYGLSRNFRIVRLPCIDLLPVFSGKSGFLLQAISFFISAKIYTLFNSFDFIYVRDFLAALFLRSVFFEVHNLPKKIGFLFRTAIKHTKYFFPVTNYLKDDLISLGISDKNVRVVPDGVNLSMFSNHLPREEARRLLNLPLDKNIVLYTGSFYLYSWKGVDVLIESARNFSDDTKFLLVGGSEEEISEIKKKNVASNILLFKHVSHKNIPIYMFAADVLVLPNKSGDIHSERYTSPLKLFEYMASGRPIVASKLPSITEILSEKDAILVEPNSPGALKDGIIKLLGNRDLALNIGNLAKKKAEAYSWKNRALTILNVILRV